MAKRRRSVEVIDPVLDPDHEGEATEKTEDIQDVGAEEITRSSEILVGTVATCKTEEIEGILVPSNSVIELPRTVVEAVDLRLPLIEVADSDPAYVTRHVDVKLTARQAKTLREIYLGLNEIHQKMANHQHVDTQNDAIRWILDQVANVYDQNHSEA